ncbi:amidase [Sphaerisporangium fuscum]|uniref:amidase n=1 Tax=Sphaerisporangium fuscum TaxID=2835868 RepID=UPI001BDD4DC4|nr:amidase [Sphaerisporangium fuscum]
MHLHEYTQYDAVGLRDLIKAGEVTAAEVEAVARRALAVANAQVNGLALPVFSPALDHASDGPFTGAPFLIKDHGPVAKDVPFFLGSRSLPGIVPPHDSDLMARFRAAGLVTLGLTTVPELTISFSTESVEHGPTRNPWDLERGVGGSSGGAAALVAAGAVPLAHGSDGAGSIRIPAACCGLVGLKPSRGRVPCGPDQGEAMLGMACEFALTRTVRDAAHLLDAVQGPGVGDKYTAPPPRGRYADEPGADPGRLRVALTTEAWSGAVVDGEVAAAAVEAGRALERMGHLVTEYDLLVTPTLGRLPAPHGTLRYDDPAHTLTSWLESIFDYGPFTMVFNISGQPAISLPLGTGDGGLPIGVQIVASYGREDLLFRIAAQLERALPWKDRTPRFSVSGQAT